jgi:hypothetical protein
MPTRFEWRQDAFMRSVEATTEKKLEMASTVVKDNIKVLINRGNSDGRHPSLPGEPPKKVTGRLFRSIAFVIRREGKQLVSRIGTDVPYGRRLELGYAGTDSSGRTYHQASRPFLRPGLQRSLGVMRRIFGIG